MKAWKWIVIVVGVILALGVVGVVWWKSPGSKDTKKKAAEKFAPEVTSVSMSITDIDDKRIKLNNRIVVRNNLPMDINANKVSYVLYIDSIKVLEDSYDKPITVRAEDTTVVEMPMEILAEPMKRVIEYIEKNDIDTNQYAIEATVHLDVPIRGETAFDIKASKRMPSIRLFKIDILDSGIL